MTKPTSIIQKYFGYSASESQGLILLIPILVLMISLPRMLKTSIEESNSADSVQDERELLEWFEKSQAALSVDQTLNPSTDLFNPNEINSLDWEKKGFSKSVARRIVNYRLSGRDYRTKEELLKIYGINQRLLKAYFPYMVIPKPNKKQFVFPDVKKVVKALEKSIGIISINLNEASAEELQQIRGIGPVLSKRIIKYRTSLGGFQHSSQLQEVYGIDRALYLKMDSSITPFVPVIQKITLNQDSIKVLAKHPYINYKTAKAIVKYRKQHGDYTEINELKKIHIISDSLFTRIKDYLSIEPME